MEAKLTAIIIEDEDNSYILLKKTLEEYCQNIQVIAHAKSIKEGRKIIVNSPCDIVFMDVELQDGKSFEILELLEQKVFHLVFTTAYDHYAIKAIKFEATDYLLKPYSPSEVVKAVQKVRRKISLKQDFENSIHKESDYKIKLETKESIEMVNANEIIYCEADGSYTQVYLTDNRRILLSKTLKIVENQTYFSNFFRIHASYLVNINHIKKFLKCDGGWVALSNGRELPVSRRKRQDFLEIL